MNIHLHIYICIFVYVYIHVYIYLSLYTFIYIVHRIFFNFFLCFLSILPLTNMKRHFCMIAIMIAFYLRKKELKCY
jgi:hypothetical protein